MFQDFLPWTLLPLVLHLVSPSVAESYSNPLRTFNGGDPSLVYEDGWYYLMTTNQVDLKITRAQTLDGLKDGETKSIYSDSDPNRCCTVWAPELHKVNGNWVIHYTAGTNGTSDNQRSHVVQGGPSPWDTYSFLGTINTPSWSIDSTRVTINDQEYFVYSCQRSDIGEKVQSLCIGTFTGPTTIDSEHWLASPTYDWERLGLAVNEGPFALYHDGKTFLTYSASFCQSTSYALGLLTYNSGDPLDRNSWTKSPRPVFIGTDEVFGVGHNSFFTSPDGSETWMTHHSTPNPNGDCGTDRYVNVKKVEWNEDGTPNFGQPIPYNQVNDGPAARGT